MEKFLMARFDVYANPSSHALTGLEGAGLGLAITQAIMQAHGGTIAVSSAQGQTVFTLSFRTTG